VKKKALILMPVLIVAAVAATFKLIDVYHVLETQSEAVETQWANVDDALEQRAELAPKLVEAVRSFAKRDDPAFRKVEEAREAFRGAHAPQDRIAASERLSLALTRVLLLTENYPKLQTNPDFRRVQDELAASENRVAVERRKYNEILEHYNAQIQLFPDNVVASMSGFHRNDAYFRTDGANGGIPKVQF
jgi:LemA protein